MRQFRGDIVRVIDYNKTNGYFTLKYLDDDEIFTGSINVDNHSLNNDTGIVKLIIDNDKGAVLPTKERCILLDKNINVIFNNIKDNYELSNEHLTSTIHNQYNVPKGFQNLRAKKPNSEDIFFHFYYRTSDIKEENSPSNRLIDAFKRNPNPEEYKYEKHCQDFEFFYNTFIKYFVNKYRFEIADYMICIVPGHEQNIMNNGPLVNLCNRISRSTRCTNALQLLIRTQTIKSHFEKDKERNEEIHLSSIILNKSINIEDKKILLIDDITTSGSSLKACKKILLNGGAKEVVCFAFGKASN